MQSHAQRSCLRCRHAGQVVMSRVWGPSGARPGRRGTATTVSLGKPDIVEQELNYWGKSRSGAVVLFLPALTQDSIAQVLEILGHKQYLSSIVLVLTGAAHIDGDVLRAHPQRQCLRVIRVGNPRLEVLQSRLEQAGLQLPSQGRTLALWYALGYLMAASPAEAVVVHEAQSINPQLIAGSLHPLLSPHAGMQISKVCGQLSDGWSGAPLLSPFFDALAEACGHSAYLQYLISFFDPPSLCVAFQGSLAGSLRLPQLADVQLALLSELQRRVPINNLCQIRAAALALRRNGDQCRELAALLLENLRAEGMILSVSQVHSIKLNFQQRAQSQLASCRSQSAIKGAAFNQHEAERFVQRFADTAFAVGCQLAQGEDLVRALPSWKRAVHAFPEALTHLNAAVERDFSELTSMHPAMPLPVNPARAESNSEARR